MSTTPTIIRTHAPWSLVVYERVPLPSLRVQGMGPAFVDGTVADLYVVESDKFYRVGRGIAYLNPTDEHDRRKGVLLACRRAVYDGSENRTEYDHLRRTLLFDVAAELDTVSLVNLIGGRDRVLDAFTKLLNNTK